MNQSDRIRMYEIYYSHPLRGEYDKKRKEICRNKPKSVKLIYAGFTFFVVMFFVFGVIAFTIDPFDDVEGEITIALAVGNLAFGFVMFLLLLKTDELTEEYNKKELESLDREYQVKGLVRMTEQELYKSPCGELDLYDYPVCSVTKQMLSESEYVWCRQSGNCRHCRIFMSYVTSPDFVKKEEQSNPNWYKK